jgi:pilus assembly protein Flp/PilA
MEAMMELILKLTDVLNRAKREEGQGLVEYALILVLVSIVAIGALKFLGGSISDILSNIGSTLGSA